MVMRKPRVFVLAAMLSAAVLVPASEAHAALNAYLKLRGQKVGEIKGSVTQKGREGAIKVIAVSHEIVAPRDPASGLATGKRMHKPFVFTLEVDRSTPQLLGAIAGNEKLPAVVFEMGGGKDGAALYRINLINASIASFEYVTLDDSNTAAIRLTLTYQKIEWQWVPEGITGADDWESPVVKKSL
jgi:type VI secretion system secreted protein Hcp